jgi:hypothetical protein
LVKRAGTVYCRWRLSPEVVQAIRDLVAQEIAKGAPAYGLESSIVEEKLRQALGMPPLKKEGNE